MEESQQSLCQHRLDTVRVKCVGDHGCTSRICLSSVSVCVSVSVCTCVCEYTRVCTCMHTCACVCACECVYVGEADG